MPGRITVPFKRGPTVKQVSQDNPHTMLEASVTSPRDPNHIKYGLQGIFNLNAPGPLQVE